LAEIAVQTSVAVQLPLFSYQAESLIHCPYTSIWKYWQEPLATQWCSDMLFLHSIPGSISNLFQNTCKVKNCCCFTPEVGDMKDKKKI
jgi:hypothetical protein